VYRVIGVVVGLVALCALGASLAAVESSSAFPFTVTSQMQAAARSSCRSALPGTRVLIGTPITVGEVRAFPPRTHPLKARVFPHHDAFPGLSKTQIVAWCWTRGTKAGEPTVAYVVAPGSKPLEIAVRFPQRPTTAPQGSSTSPTTATPGISPPDVVGMSLVTAQRTISASAGGTALTVSAQVVRAGIAPETVISQQKDSVVVSVPPASPCSSTQLAATYLFGQPGVGNVFASIVVRNTSASWCTVGAPIQLAGLGADGRGVSGPAAVGSLEQTTMDALSPGTPPVPATTPTVLGTGIGYPLGTFFAWVGFYGPFNTCTPEIPGSSVKHVAASVWRVTLGSGVAVDARNGTPSLVTTPTAPASRTARPFETCAGTILSLAATVRFGNTNLLPG
jgi:hypothetical protein